VPRFAIAPLGLTTEGSTKFKLKGWKCYLKKLQCSAPFVQVMWSRISFVIRLATRDGLIVPGWFCVPSVFEHQFMFIPVACWWSTCEDFTPGNIRSHGRSTAATPRQVALSPLRAQLFNESREILLARCWFRLRDIRPNWSSLPPLDLTKINSRNVPCRAGSLVKGIWTQVA